MTPERAKAIWDSRGPYGDLQMTADEKAFVTGIWRRMAGHTCFADALLRIAQGETQGLLPLIGTVVFRHGAEIIDQSPVYAGETVDSPSVMDRARRAVAMLGMNSRPDLRGQTLQTLLEGAEKQFYPLGA